MIKDLFVAIALSLWEGTLKLRAILGSKKAKNLLTYHAYQDAKQDALYLGLHALDHKLNEDICALAGIDYQKIYQRCLEARLKRQMRYEKLKSILYPVTGITLIILGILGIMGII